MLADPLLRRNRGGAGDLALVLQLPRISGSIDFRIYFEPVGDRPLLQWIVDRFSRVPIPATRFILCSSLPDEHRVVEMLGASVWNTWLSRRASQVMDLRLLANEVGCETIALVGMPVAFGPADLIRRTCEHHFAGKYEYTNVTNFPDGVGVQVFKSTLLGQITSLPVPLADDLASCIVQINAAMTYADHGGPVPIQLGRFNGARNYSIPRDTLPQAVSLKTSRDLQIARTVIAQAQDDAECALLQMWKTAVVRNSIELNGRVRGGIMRRAPASTVHPRRVLYVSNSSAYSGGSESLVQLVANLDPLRYAPSALVAYEGLLTSRLRAAGAHVIVPNHDFSTTPLNRPPASPKQSHASARTSSI